MKVDIEKFEKVLREKNVLYLISNPLMNYLVSYLYFESGDLPEMRSKIYEEIFKKSVKHIEEKFKLDIRLRRKLSSAIEYICSKIAYRMLESNSTYVDLDAVDEMWEEYWAKEKARHLGISAEEFLNTCVFTVYDSSSDRIYFVHETFKEFFAAKYLGKEDWRSWLKERIEKEKPVEERTGLLDIKEVLKMLFSMLSEEDRKEFIFLLYNAEIDELVKYPVLCECLGEVGISLTDRHKLVEYGIPDFKEKYIEEIKQGIDLDFSYPLFTSLVSAKDVKLLKELLKDEDAEVRRRAAEALGKIGDRRAVELLIEALRDGNPMVRIAAAEALGKIGDKRAVEPLIEALKDENAGVREAAAWALGEIGDKRAVEPLIEALKDEDEWVRLKAAWALRAIATKSIGNAILVKTKIKGKGQQ